MSRKGHPFETADRLDLPERSPWRHAIHNTGACAANASFFNGSAYGAVRGLIQRPPNVTLSAWVRFSATDTSGGDVISLGDSVVLRVTTSEVQGVFYTGSAWRTTTASVAVNDNRWHHLTYTIDTQNSI